jgi:hypothetical protein
LTEADRTRVVDALKRRFETAKAALLASGLLEESLINLDSVMRTAMSVDAALEQGPPTLSDVLAD